MRSFVGELRDGSRSGRVADLIAALAGAAVTVLAVLRAVRIPITHDEAFSYLRFIDVPLAESFSFRGTDAANNHHLLTVLDRVLVALLGPSELVLRLPVLVSFVAALTAAWLLLRRRCPPTVALAGFLVFGLNRLGVELFSLARGYGLAVGLSLCGVYLLVRAAEQGLRPLPATVGLSLLVLAALAQLTLLDIWAGASAAFLLVGFDRHRRREKTPEGDRKPILGVVRLVAVSAVACGATAIPLALSMNAEGSLYAGGRDGLLSDTVGTLVRETLARAPWAGPLRGPLTFAAVFAAAFVLLAVGALLLSHAGRGEGIGALFVGSTFVLTVLAVEVQVHLLGVGYPVDRMAYPLLPLLVLSSCLAAGWLLRDRDPLVRRTANVFAGLLSVAAVVQLAATADVSRSRLWWFDADSRRVLEDVAERVSARRPPDSSVSVGISWILEPGLNYYRVVRGMSWLRPFDRTGLGGVRDFYVVASPDRSTEDARGLAAVRTFEETGTVIAVAGPERLRAGMPSLVSDGGLPEPGPDLPLDRPESVVWIPVVVRATGLDGSEWRSDLRIVNTGGAPARCVVSMRWKGALRQGAVGVPAGGEATVADVAGQLGVEGSGPLEVRSRGDLEVSASVYDATRAPDGASVGKGWFGSVQPRDGLGVGHGGRLDGLEESHRSRTNVAFLNLGPTVAEVAVSYSDSRGNDLGTARRALQPGEWRQETRPIAAFMGGAAAIRASARVKVTRGEGVVAWATVIDSTTHSVRVAMARR